MSRSTLLLAVAVMAAFLCCIAVSGPIPAAVQASSSPTAGPPQVSAAAERYVGWAVGGPDSGYGAIFRSVDGGTTWERQGSPADIPNVLLESVAALDPLTCWVVGDNDSGYGTILRTEDGGATWTRQGSPATISDAGLAKISALDRDTAWVVGTPGTILFTEDGGRNWAQKQTADIPPILLQGVYALDKDNVWVTGDTYNGYGTIFRTSDGGTSWHRKGSTTDVPDSALLDVHAVDSDTAWIASRGSPSTPATSVLHTDDNGATWIEQDLGTGLLDTNSLTTIGPDIVWVVTDADGIYRTDNGKDFVKQAPAKGKYAYFLVCIHALNENTAWASGPASIGPGNAAGIVEHTSDGGKTWVKQLELEMSLQAVSFTRPSTYYFAEGSTRPGFEPYLCIANPGDADADVAINYMLGDGTVQEQFLSVPAASRATLKVSSVLGSADDTAHDFSAVVACTNGQVIVAERPMYFSYGADGWPGGHCVVGAEAPADNWYFAEGYTGPGFEEWVCVLNPGDARADLTFRFQTEEEGEMVITGWAVQPHSRGSFKVNDLLGPDYRCSLALESSQPVVVERPMYFQSLMIDEHAGGTSDGGHPNGAIPSEPYTGGHCVVGATSLSDTFYFAEGTTRFGFDEWLTIQNPGSESIAVDAVYQPAPGQGEKVEESYSVEPGKRYTVDVSYNIGISEDISVRLTSDSLFLAERPMYFDSIYFNYTGDGISRRTGGSCIIGATDTAREWFFAEGYTGVGFQEWLTLYNPGESDALVEITYYTQEEGTLPARTATVPAGSRMNVLVNDSAGEGYQLSCRVVVTSGPGIVAERPMYFNYNGVWRGGHATAGFAP